MTLGQWKTGLLRLYIILAVPWAIWFGYAAYQAHSGYASSRDYANKFEKHPAKDWSNYHQAVKERDEFLVARNSNLISLSVVPVGYPIAVLALLWVVAGFQRR